MRYMLFAAVAALASSGCSSLGGQLADVVFLPNPNSAKVLDETVGIAIAYSPDETRTRFEPPKPSNIEAMAAAALPVAAALSGAVVDGIGKTLTAEAERYQATYSADASGDHFYFRPFATAEARPDEDGARLKTDVRFAGFKLSRRAKTDDKRDANAMSACFVALPGSTDEYFYLIPVSYELNYAKAKLVAFDLTSPFGIDILNPWEIVTDPLMHGGYELPPHDRDVDVKISVSLQNIFFDKAGKLNVVNAAAEAISLDDVTVGEEGARGYFPGYAAFRETLAPGQRPEFDLACQKETTSDAIAAIRDAIFRLKVDNAARMTLIASGRAFPSPRRAVAEGSSNANFLVKAAVEETDEYGARVKELAAAFDEKKEPIRKGLTDLLNGEE